MAPIIPRTERIWDTRLNSKSGLFSGGHSGSVDHPLIEFLVALLLGALVGLIIGFILSSLLRYLSLVLGRQIGGAAWPIYSALVGACLFGILSATRDE